MCEHTIGLREFKFSCIHFIYSILSGVESDIICENYYPIIIKRTAHSLCANNF